MKNIYNQGVVWMFIVLIFGMACNRPKQIPPFDPAFEPYIEAFTCGTIASDAPIVVKLAFEVDTSKFKGLKASDLLTSNPGISGTLSWTDARTLVFKPEKSFKEGKIYVFDLHLNKLINNIPRPLSHFKFEVQIMEQGFQLYNWSLQATSRQGVTRWNVVGEVRSANPMTEKDTRGLLEVVLNEKSLRLNWTLQGSKVLTFVSDTFSKPSTEGPIKMKILSAKVNIPLWLSDTLSWAGQGLEPVMWRMFFGEENYLWIAFSEPLDPQQNLTGLIMLDGQAPKRFIIRDNELFCYFDPEFTGGEKLEIFPGISDLNGQILSMAMVKEIKGIHPRPELKWLREGTIFPLSGEVNLPFAAIGLKKVDVRVIKVLQSNIKFFLQYQEISGSDELRRVGKVIARTTLDLTQNENADPSHWEVYYLNLNNLVKAEPGAIYRVTLSMKPEYSTYPCSSADLSGNDVSEESESTEDYEYYEGDAYDDYYLPRGWRWEQRDNPCHVSYYSSNRWISTNLLATNLALTAKVGTDGVVRVWAADIIRGEPIQGVDIEVYDFQMVLLNKGKTGSGGLAALPVNGQSFLVIASRKNEKSYLRLNEGGELPVSSFEVDGAPVQKGIRGFIYGERGVWRPGDTLHLWFMLDKQRANLPKEYPIVLELKNPQGQVVYRQVSTQETEGIYAFKYASLPQAPTGKWLAQVKVGQAVFSRILNLETIEPNRLKISLQMQPQKPSDPDIIMNLGAVWLHGAPASGLQAKVEATFKAGNFSPESYRGFIFQDEARAYKDEKFEVFSGALDADGKIVFKYRPKLENAPGMMHVLFTTRVFEPGGAFSIDQTEMNLHPFERYAGFRLPQTQNEWENYSNEKPLPIELALVDKKGKPVVGESTITLSLYHLEWRWWVGWGQNRSTYLDNELTEPVVKTDIRMKDGRARYELPTQGLDGRFLLVVSDPETQQKSSKIVYIGNFWGEGTSQARGMVFLKADKNKIKVGEKASIIIPSVRGAQILVCLESGGTLLDYKWISSEGERTVFAFRTTPEMVPGVYVFASVIQPWEYPNDLPIRMYGMSYLEIENSEAQLMPVIKVASQLRSGQKAQIKVSEAGGRPMAYTLAFVDEGLLDLTRFSTPDPYSAFFAKEALAIRTWDSYRDIINSFTTRMDRSYLVGGDEYRRPHDNLLARRFKPLVIARGPFRLGKGKTNLHTVDIPEFIGSARVMLVAAGEGAYGSADETVKILKPLIVLGSVPRVLGPGEEVYVSAAVWKYDAKISEASVKLELSGDLSLMGPQEQKVVFAGRETEKNIWFRVKTGKSTGIGHFRFTARWENEKSVWESDIDLRNPNPVVTESSEYLAAAGKKVPIGLPQNRGEKGSLILEVSSFPSINLMRRIHELLQYPYGCAEQTTSALFPQLLLNQFTPLDSLQMKKRNRNLREGIQKLVTAQVAGGGIGFWPGMQSADEWVSSWVGHFMLEARKQGFVIPSTFFNNWLAYQRKMSQQWRYSGYDVSATVQAYRLFTLALAGASDLGAMNRLRTNQKLPAEACLLLAQAYSLSGFGDVAIQLVNTSTSTTPISAGEDPTLGSDLRNQALRLYVLAQLKMNREETFRLARSIASVLSSPEVLSTQSVAWALIALQAYLEENKTTYLPEFVLKAGGKSSFIKSEANVWTYYPSSQETSLTVENKSVGPLYVNLTRSYRPKPEEQTSARSNGLTLQVFYLDASQQPFIPLRIKQGTDFIIKARVSNTSGRLLQHTALNLVLASGWQILNTRFMNDEGEPAQRNYIWQDIRDDRVYTFFTLGAGETKEFTFRINASYAGRFFMPALLAEDMYHPEISALVPGFFTEVYVL
ncbi:MAG: alpha-2-macroglobulin family protein [Bacteroidales bacterium]